MIFKRRYKKYINQRVYSIIFRSAKGAPPKARNKITSNYEKLKTQHFLLHLVFVIKNCLHWSLDIYYQQNKKYGKYHNFLFFVMVFQFRYRIPFCYVLFCIITEYSLNSCVTDTNQERNTEMPALFTCVDVRSRTDMIR